jgi:hypothetical protein
VHVRFLSIFDKSSPEPAIDPHLGVLDPATSERVGAYLRSGVPLMSTTQKVPDAVTGAPAAVVPISIVTDGEYVWSMAVAYYVEAHHVSPGEEFITHCARNQWAIPELSDTDVAASLNFVNSARQAR